MDPVDRKWHMTTPPAPTVAPRKAHARRSLDVWIAPGLAGFAMFSLTGLFGFEEPNGWLLLLSALLALSSPAAVFLHLYLTSELTSAEKRIWLREFTSPACASALADYLTATDLRATTVKRAQARARRDSPRNNLSSY
jgi:hypothetical protein